MVYLIIQSERSPVGVGLSPSLSAEARRCGGPSSSSQGALGSPSPLPPAICTTYGSTGNTTNTTVASTTAAPTTQMATALLTGAFNCNNFFENINQMNQRTHMNNFVELFHKRFLQEVTRPLKPLSLRRFSINNIIVLFFFGGIRKYTCTVQTKQCHV